MAGENGKVIWEVIAFGTKLPDSARQKVESYLAHKWGLTSTFYKPSIPGYRGVILEHNSAVRQILAPVQPILEMEKKVFMGLPFQIFLQEDLLLSPSK